MSPIPNDRPHIRLTSHPSTRPKGLRPIRWGSADPQERGPVVGGIGRLRERNVIGSYGGAYAIYRALSVTAGRLSPSHAPDLSNTAPLYAFGPHLQWGEPNRIVSLDPFGHVVTDVFADVLAQGYGI